MEKGRVSLSHCNYLVLDEADRMLDMGFMPEIQKMVENEDMPKKAPEGERQTLMFSATFPDEVQESAQEFLADDYLFLTVGLVGGACSDVKQVEECPELETDAFYIKKFLILVFGLLCIAEILLYREVFKSLYRISTRLPSLTSERSWRS